MYCKDLIALILERAWSVAELAELLQEHPNDIESDLEHLLLSLRHEPCRVLRERARCRKCGFEFGTGRLPKPGKCPRCRGTWIEPPRIGLSARR
jgi:predicted Zn-ribbon and HTH transcriptional regulator